MNLTQAFKIAVKSIAAKKARSALTMLGVIIGLAAVIILVSYAQGQNQQMRAYYESLGTNTVNVDVWASKDVTKALRDYCEKLRGLKRADKELGISYAMASRDFEDKAGEELASKIRRFYDWMIDEL